MSQWQWGTLSTRNTFRYKHMLQRLEENSLETIETYGMEQQLTRKERDELKTTYREEKGNCDRC